MGTFGSHGWTKGLKGSQGWRGDGGRGQDSRGGPRAPWQHHQGLARLGMTFLCLTHLQMVLSKEKTPEGLLAREAS